MLAPPAIPPAVPQFVATDPAPPPPPLQPYGDRIDLSESRPPRLTKTSSFGSLSGWAGSSQLLGAIHEFDKGARLKKVRRQSRAFAVRPSHANGPVSVGGGQARKPGPPPPLAGAGSEVQMMNDIASVLARAIMRRRDESMLDEEPPSPRASEWRSGSESLSDGDWATSP